MAQHKDALKAKHDADAMKDCTFVPLKYEDSRLKDRRFTFAAR